MKTDRNSRDLFFRNKMSLFLSKDGFVQNVAVLVGGTSGGVLLVLIASPLLTRLYKPEDFGILAVFTSLLFIINSFSSLKYEFAIPIAESDQEASSIAVLCLAIVITVSLVSVFSISFWGQEISALMNEQGLKKHLWLLPIAILIAGLHKVCSYWALRMNSYNSLASAKLKQSMTLIFGRSGCRVCELVQENDSMP